MNQPKIQRFLHYLNLKRGESHSSNLACCNRLRQSQQECDHSSLLTANATDLQSLDTRGRPFVNKLMEHGNNTQEDKQRYYLCDYYYEGERWSIEIPAESWEDAKARLKRMAYAEVVGEIQSTLPVEFGLWVKLWVWLRSWG
jgi:hypothetical protein